MDWSNRKYIIMTTSDVTDEMKDNSLSYKLSADESKVMLKWDGDTPSCFDGLTTYTHSEILTELAKSEWTGE
jgi:hypothetical protein